MNAGESLAMRSGWRYDSKIKSISQYLKRGRISFEHYKNKKRHLLIVETVRRILCKSFDKSDLIFSYVSLKLYINYTFLLHTNIIKITILLIIIMWYYEYLFSFNLRCFLIKYKYPTIFARYKKIIDQFLKLKINNLWHRAQEVYRLRILRNHWYVKV